MIIVNQPTINIISNEESGKAASKFVRDIVRSGGDDLKLIAEEETIAHATSENSKYFKALPKGEFLSDNTSDIHLRVLSPVFEGGSSWKFHDGRKSFSAKIEDKDFLESVRLGSERFGSGDILHVTLRGIQRRDGRRLVAEFFIEKVISHERYDGRQLEFDGV